MRLNPNVNQNPYFTEPSLPLSAYSCPRRRRIHRTSMALSSADQIEQEFADELQHLSLKEEEEAAAVAQVVSMGFSKKKSVSALERSGGDVARAIDGLLAASCAAPVPRPPVASPSFSDDGDDLQERASPEKGREAPSRAFSARVLPGEPTFDGPTAPSAKAALPREAATKQAASATTAAEPKRAAPTAKAADPKPAAPKKPAPRKRATPRERTVKRMAKGKRVAKKLKHRSRQMFQFTCWVLLIAAFAAGFLYIKRRWAETPTVVPLESVFGAPANTHIELDITVGDTAAGSLSFELLDQVATETAQAFAQRCRAGAQDGNEFYRISPGFVAQAGDDSDAQQDIVVKPFLRGLIRHDRRGMLVMARAGPWSMTSQIFITLDGAPFLDGRHVAFGAIVAGTDVLDTIEAQGSAAGAPLTPVRIAKCRVLHVPNKGVAAPLYPMVENYGRIEL